MTRREIEHVLADMEPGDGFGVQKAVVGQEYSLHLVFRHGGEIVQPLWLSSEARPTAMFWCRKDLSDHDFGEMSRLQILVEALCRFINTGGDFETLDRMLDQLRQLMGSIKAEPAIPGFHLINTEINTEGNYEHIFAREDSDLAVRWVENQFLDVVSLDSLHQELVIARTEEQPYVDFTGTEGYADPSGPGAGELESERPADPGPARPAAGETETGLPE